MAATKDSRLNVRIRDADNALIRAAADQTGQSISEFMTTSAVERAHDVLADQRSFILDEDTWDAFVEMLDRPPRPDPRLVELFSRPSRIARR